MERPVSFDVTDYNPEGDDWSNDLIPHRDSMSRPSSPPIHQNPEMKVPEDATEYVTITLDIVGNNVVVEENAEPMVRRRQESRKKSVVNRRINSKEFALGLFYTLASQRDISCEGVSKSELLELWCQINDQCFDSRLRMFFDIDQRLSCKVESIEFVKCRADKDGDGRLSEEEVKQVKRKLFIRLTASANTQSTTQNMVDKYAAMIMKELDPYDFGYIMMESLKELLLDVETLSENKITSTDQETKKPTTKRWYKVIRDIPSSSLIPCLKKTSSTKKT
ncbi:hypothetical protein YC2023_001755 [Brassica napus]